MANSPSALGGYLAFRGVLVKGVLKTALREQLALLIAEDNGCEYCVSAHAFRGQKIGLTDEAIAKTRNAEAADEKSAAALRFARAVLATKGAVSDDALADARSAGCTDEELGEVVAHVALNVFSNYFNHVARPELDFPRVAVRPHV